MIRYLYSLLIAFPAVFLVGNAARAQVSPEDLLLQYQQQLQAGQAAAPAPAAVLPTVPQTPEVSAPVAGPPSDIEKDFRARGVGSYGDDLSQVGYGSLAGAGGLTSAALVGAVQGNYRLGVGDQIVMVLRGQRNATYQATIDRDGRAVLPDLAPISAAGRTFAEFRDELTAQVKSSFVQTEAFISLGAVRQITLLVTGQVGRPGVSAVSGLASVLDVLIQAGGIRKTGSLRRIQVIRGIEVREIDLYSVLLGVGAQPDLSIQDGDRVFVPPIGPTVAVSGSVIRPGIYELLNDGIDANALIALAGGTLTPTGYRLLKNSPSANGRTTVSEISVSRPGNLSRGDVLVVDTKAKGSTGIITIVGNFTHTGIRSLAAVPTLGSILGDHANLGGSPYLPFVVVSTIDKVTMNRRYTAVDATRPDAGRFQLHDQDVVILLAAGDVAYLSSPDVQGILGGGAPLYGRNEGAGDAPPSTPGVGPAVARALTTCAGLRRLATRVSRRDLNGFQTLIGDNPDLPDVQPCPVLYDDYPELLPFLVEHLVVLRGNIRQPGVYPVIPGTRLADLIRTVGDVTSDADPNGVEYIKTGPNGEWIHQRITLQQAMASLVIEPQMEVRFSSRFTNRDVGPVTLRGEVRRPGVYPISRGERLSDLLDRAGGLTDQAFVLGTVFQRDSVRQQEQESYARLEREVQESIPSIIQQTTANKEGDQGAVLQALQQVLAYVKSAPVSGRLVVEADPVMLKSRPDEDMVLQPGDSIYIPKRPASVAVAGEVQFPGARRFAAGTSVSEYLDQAGGLTENADSSRIFVVLPNGEAKPVSTSFWNFTDVQLPPGSTIIVPRDLTVLSWWGAFKDILQITANVAISAAALATLGN